MRKSSIAAVAAGAVLAIGLGLSGSAMADDDDDDYYDTPTSFAPDIYADPATEWVPWAGDQNNAYVPDTDTTVHCDGCAG